MTGEIGRKDVDWNFWDVNALGLEPGQTDVDI